MPHSSSGTRGAGARRPPGAPPARSAVAAICFVCAAGALLAGCTGPQSSLDPAGRDAARIAELFTVMTVGAAIVWVAVVGLTLYASRTGRRAHSPRFTRGLIVIGGVVVPVFVLGALLVYGLAPLPDVLALPQRGGLTIAVTGEQWWWRVRYQPADGPPFELANEIRLPVGRRIELQLESADVIHAFWLPSLAGKMDLVPGRTNRLAIEPTRTGVFRGACAEYCGLSHANMAFYAVVLEEDEFEQWMRAQAREAQAPASELTARGQAAFVAHGCGACHAVRGTEARGVIGPDLTHLGSRLSIGAGIRRNHPGELQTWIQATGHVKPGVRMPPYDMLPGDEVRALAAYLTELR